MKTFCFFIFITTHSVFRIRIVVSMRISVRLVRILLIYISDSCPYIIYRFALFYKISDLTNSCPCSQILTTPSVYLRPDYKNPTFSNCGRNNNSICTSQLIVSSLTENLIVKNRR